MPRPRPEPPSFESLLGFLAAEHQKLQEENRHLRAEIGRVGLGGSSARHPPNPLDSSASPASPASPAAPAAPAPAGEAAMAGDAAAADEKPAEEGERAATTGAAQASRRPPESAPEGPAADGPADSTTLAKPPARPPAKPQSPPAQPRPNQSTGHEDGWGPGAAVAAAAASASSVAAAALGGRRGGSREFLESESECRPRSKSVFGPTGVLVMGLQGAMAGASEHEGQWKPPESIRKVRMQQFILNPEQSTFLEQWTLLTMICLMFVAIVAPVQLSLMDPKFDALLAVNCGVDVVFTIDLLMQFFLMYPKKRNYGYILENSPRAIALHYLRTWFAIDLISIVPFDLLALVSQSQSIQQVKAIKAIRLLRCLKILRVLRASRVVRRYEVHMSITYSTFALTKFFITLLIITHWLANLWALTLVLVDESQGVPRWIDGFEDMDANVVHKTKDTAWKIYLQSLYFTSYTITSVGYGDIGPQNVAETLICTLMIVVAGISWAVLLGEVCGIISQMHLDEQTFRSTMDELNHMMLDRMMPNEMRRRLRSFFLSKKVADRRGRHEQIIKAMSPGLQGQVVMHMNRMWIAKVRFLSQILQGAEGAHYGPFFYSFLVDVSLSMQVAIHAQSEVFGAVQTLYILNRGLIARQSQGLSGEASAASTRMGVSSVLSAGAVWGVDFVLSDARLLEHAESLALTYTEAMTLRRGAFLELVEKHRENCPEVKRNVRRFCCWLAFQRAFLQEAKKRQRPSQQKQRAQLVGDL